MSASKGSVHEKHYGSRERPILFSAPMVRAILDGRKTATRRIVKPQPELTTIKYTNGFENVWTWKGTTLAGERERFLALCPYGKPGDRLWVRETWGVVHEHGNDLSDRELIDDALHGVPWAAIVYNADAIGGHASSLLKRWRPSIHMPRKAARILLEVESVGVELLQDITEENARAEGVTPFPLDREGDIWTDGTHRTAFNFLWNEINGWNPNSFDSNPWVWVVTFKRVQP